MNIYKHNKSSNVLVTLESENILKDIIASHILIKNEIFFL